MIARLDAGNCRLIPLTAEHEARYIELANHPLIRDRVNNLIPYAKAQFEELLASCRSNSRHLVWMIEVDGNMAGSIATHADPESQRFQGGYWIDPQYCGRGLATAALQCSNQFLFDHCGAIRIQAVVEPDNLASIAVLEKAGYQREGLLQRFYPSRYRGLIDVYMYAVIKE